MDTPYGLTEAESVLAAELYHKVTPKLIRAYRRKWPNDQDLIVSASGLGVVEAVRDWQPGEGLDLDDYASYRATMRIRSDLGLEHRRLKVRAHYWPDMDRFLSPGEPADSGPLWTRLTAGLTPVELETVRQLYGHGLGIAAAARAMKVTTATADKRRRAALDRLRILMVGVSEHADPSDQRGAMARDQAQVGGCHPDPTLQHPAPVPGSPGCGFRR